MKQHELIDFLATRILACAKDLPFCRVGFDGVDTSGKTFLADALAQNPRLAEVNVVRASVDGFHKPREMRHRRGRHSAEGYYHDSFDVDELRKRLLDPLGPSGNGRFQRRVFDYRTDHQVESPIEEATSGTILLFDGVFLGRPNLADCWELHVFLHVPFEVVLKRAAQRDAFMGSEEEITLMYTKRYIPGQQLYLNEVRPQETSDIVIDNTDYNAPFLLRS